MIYYQGGKMSTKKYNHVHKFRRDRYSTGRAFHYCTLDCTFKIDVKHSFGKTSLCNKCNKPFTMNEYSIRAAKPVCMDCINRRNETPIILETDIDSILGVKLNANTMDRHNTTTIPTTETQTNSISSLQNRMRSIVVKEYNPEDD